MNKILKTPINIEGKDFSGFVIILNNRNGRMAISSHGLKVNDKVIKSLYDAMKNDEDIKRLILSAAEQYNNN